MVEKHSIFNWNVGAADWNVGVAGVLVADATGLPIVHVMPQQRY